MSEHEKIKELFAFPHEDETEQFNQAFRAYKDLPNADQFMIRKTNQLGFSRNRLGDLLYDLKKKSGVTDVEIEEYRLQKTSSLEESKADFLKELECAGEPVEDSPEEKEVVNMAIENTYEGIEDTGVKLRDEFPFLNDGNCPKVFANVVFEKISAYNRYKTAHVKLVQHEKGEVVLTPEELNEVSAEAESSFAENRALYEELEHYSQHGEILGKHLLFKEISLQREVDAMSADEMLKFKNATRTFLSRKNNELKKETDEGKIIAIQDAINERELKLKLVDKRLAKV